MAGGGAAHHGGKADRGESEKGAAVGHHEGAEVYAGGAQNPRELPLRPPPLARKLLRMLAMPARSLRLLAAFAMAALVVAAVACGINPQPEPPGVVHDDPAKGGEDQDPGGNFDDDDADAAPGTGDSGAGGAGNPDASPDAGPDADAGDAEEPGDGGEDADAGADEDAGDGDAPEPPEDDG